jgi:transcriptional regulator with XRE-family HTH domain
MANIRNDGLGDLIRPPFNDMVRSMVSDGATETAAETEIIKRIANATSGGSSTAGDGGDVLEPQTVRQVLSGSIKNPSRNMLEGISEVLGIPIAQLESFSEEEN